MQSRTLLNAAARLAVFSITLGLLVACDSGTTDVPPGPGPDLTPVAQACDAPPFGGTVFITSTLITAADPTAYTGATSAGRGSRRMFDRRVDGWITVDAYLVRLAFSDGPDVEVQVNPEVGSADIALAEARRFGPSIGQLPHALRTDVRTVWIHRGTQPFGGGNENLLIHTGQADLYDADGVLEEALVHEAAHTSLDAAHAGSAYWTAAQQADQCAVSVYARDNPTREDIAESFLPYLALRRRPGSLSADDRAAVAASMPNRIAYFDWLALDLSPFAE
ncbi:MAG TPA: hypothetical protein VGB53_08175 [Rubricoccaceae bacterium]|jgi:hypothetical protein